MDTEGVELTAVTLNDSWDRCRITSAAGTTMNPTPQHSHNSEADSRHTHSWIRNKKMLTITYAHLVGPRGPEPAAQLRRCRPWPMGSGKSSERLS